MTSAPPPLRLRQPTGVPPWPLVVMDGVEKSGKTATSVCLAADPRVGQMFGFDLGEGSLDEYGPLSADAVTGEWKLRIVEHNGTYRDLLAQVEAACAAPRVAPHLPNAILFDTGTDLWWSLARWIEKRSRYRDKNVKLLQEDPDAELDIGRDLWNDAAERWRDVMELLRKWDGIAVVTTRGGWVSDTDERGQPKRNAPKVWSTNAHKSLPFDASVIVRMEEGRKASIVATRSLNLVVPKGGSIPLDDGWTLAEVVFDRLGLDGATTGGRVITKMVEDWPVPVAKKRLLEAYVRAGLSDDTARIAAADAWKAADLPVGGTSSVNPDLVVALIEAASGPVGVSGGADAAITPADPDPAPTGHQGTSTDAVDHTPSDAGREPDAPPPPEVPEDVRVEMIRAWVEFAGEDREAFVGSARDLDLDVTGSIVQIKKRVRDHLVGLGGWVPPEDKRHPHADGHVPDLREAWAAYLAGLPPFERVGWAMKAGLPSISSAEHLTGPEEGRVVSLLVEMGDWPPAALALGQEDDGEQIGFPVTHDASGRARS